MKKRLIIFTLVAIGTALLFFEYNRASSDQVHLEIEKESQKIIQTGSTETKGGRENLFSTKPLIKVLADSSQDGDQRVAAVSLWIQSWNQEDKDEAVQFILSSPFHSGASKITEFEITLRALVLEALAESSWGKESLSDLQKIAAFSESSFLSGRAELYRKWLSGFGPNPKDLDEKVLTQILSRQ